jgi:hypothetical protein
MVRDARRLTLLLALAWIAGCSRQQAAPGSGVVTADQPQLPFDRVSQTAGISPTGAFASDGVPAGTEIKVRLQIGLSSADAHSGDSFAAKIDEPIVFAGQTVVPLGALVTGTVLSAQAFEPLHDSGYLRVTLASITLNGKLMDVRTSSVFAKGSSSAKSKSFAVDHSGLAAIGSNSLLNLHSAKASGNGEVKFSTGHRFTFRLSEALHLPG